MRIGHDNYNSFCEMIGEQNIKHFTDKEINAMRSFKNGRMLIDFHKFNLNEAKDFLDKLINGDKLRKKRRCLINLRFFLVEPILRNDFC